MENDLWCGIVFLSSFLVNKESREITTICLRK